jgi:2-polyprenyl-6-methoxyphenol hydroxylase-like FAD-dependent oxidoreductase
MAAMTNPVFDVCVSGGGMVGKALALALSRDGWQVAWVAAAAEGVAAAASKPDVRTYALNAHSVALLTRLRVWEGIAPHATPLHGMRIEGDDTGHLAFTAWQQCVSELGFIADAAAMESTLAEALRYAPHVVKVDEVPAGVPLWAICEGKHSTHRAQLGATFERQDYAHWGVATRLTHGLPHQGIARQWFLGADTSSDVLALLPFDHPQPGSSYGLVWSTAPANAQRLAGLSPTDFEQALHERLGAATGPAWQGLRLAAEVAAWPLGRACASPWVGTGWALLGDAAHLVHPLAGQGLNLGLADVVALVRVLHEARENEAWRSIGDERILQRYERARWFDTQAMLTLTDSLVHLFGATHPLLRDVRNKGMSVVNQMAPLKRWLVNHALGKPPLST